MLELAIPSLAICLLLAMNIAIQGAATFPVRADE
jgi:hypothetical protein